MAIVTSMNYQVVQMFNLNSVWVPGTGAVSGATYNSINLYKIIYFFGSTGVCFSALFPLHKICLVAKLKFNFLDWHDSRKCHLSDLLTVLFGLVSIINLPNPIS